MVWPVAAILENKETWTVSFFSLPHPVGEVFREHLAGRVGATHGSATSKRKWDIDGNQRAVDPEDLFSVLAHPPIYHGD